MTDKNKKIQNEISEPTIDTAVVNQQVAQDLKNSILIVSLVANLFILTTWIALQVTTHYDSQLTSFLFSR